MRAAEGRVAAVRRAHVAVVADERRARGAGPALAGLGAVAGVAVRARRAVQHRRGGAARGRVAAVGRAGVAVVADERRRPPCRCRPGRSRRRCRRWRRRTPCRWRPASSCSRSPGRRCRSCRRCRRCRRAACRRCTRRPGRSRRRCRRCRRCRTCRSRRPRCCTSRRAGVGRAGVACRCSPQTRCTTLQPVIGACWQPP